MAAHEVEVVNRVKVIRVAVLQNSCALFDDGFEFACAFDHLDGGQCSKICPLGREIFITPEQLPEYLTWRLTK